MVSKVFISDQIAALSDAFHLEHHIISKIQNPNLGLMQQSCRTCGNIASVQKELQIGKEKDDLFKIKHLKLMYLVFG